MSRSGSRKDRGPRPPEGSRLNRFTESVQHYERRQRRDKLLGVAGMVVAGIVLVLNFVMEVDSAIVLLPGGHSELYFVAGLVVFGCAAWIHFDLGLTRGKRR